jgi:hypothetical protein
MTDTGMRINRVAFNFGFILVLGYAITRDIFGIPDVIGAVLLSVGAVLLVIPFIIVVTSGRRCSWPGPPSSFRATRGRSTLRH